MFGIKKKSKEEEINKQRDILIRLEMLKKQEDDKLNLLIKKPVGGKTMVRNLVKEQQENKVKEIPSAPVQDIPEAPQQEQEQPTRIVTFEEVIMNNLMILNRQQADLFEYTKRLGKAIGYEEKE